MRSRSPLITGAVLMLGSSLLLAGCSSSAAPGADAAVFDFAVTGGGPYDAVRIQLPEQVEQMIDESGGANDTFTSITLESAQWEGFGQCAVKATYDWVDGAQERIATEGSRVSDPEWLTQLSDDDAGHVRIALAMMPTSGSPVKVADVSAPEGFHVVEVPNDDGQLRTFFNDDMTQSVTPIPCPTEIDYDDSTYASFWLQFADGAGDRNQAVVYADVMKNGDLYLGGNPYVGGFERDANGDWLQK